MKKSELIAKLQEIEGDPVVCFYNGELDENREFVGSMYGEFGAAYLSEDDKKAVWKKGHIIVMEY